ncbi:hypothetical protein AC1031_019600 [Aphanomyces cochlioides]|nr:hypothetical protein AC1031_019600 [Aphanomyces cochlioides]
MDVATFSLFLLRILSACAALWLIGLDRICLALNQLHYWLAARKPQLTYKPSKVNNRILQSCPILAPLQLLLHGLTGGSRAIYIRMHADRLLKAGYRVVVMNARGCNKTPVRTPKLFSLGCTNDLRESVVHIRQRIGARVLLIGVGFSLGANLLVKYLGEEGKNAQLTSADSI